MQTLGAVHAPCPPQDGEHTGVLHVAPVQPELHVHVFGAVQLPFTQDGEHIGVLHVAPVQPELHVQAPVIQLAFVPQLVPSFAFGFEQLPVTGSQVPAV